MLKENWRFISRLERAGDVFIILLAFFVAYYGRDSLLFWNAELGLALPFRGEVLAPIKDYFIVLVVALASYSIVLNALGAYRSMRLSGIWQLLKVSIVSSVIVFGVLSTLLFSLKVDLSRSFVAFFCGLAATLLLLQRLVVLRLLRFWRRRGRNFRSVIVCGTGEQALRLTKEIVQRPELGIRIRAYADLRPTIVEGADAELRDFRLRVRTLGTGPLGNILLGPAAVERALTEYAIDEVIFTDVGGVLPQAEQVIEAASDQGIRTTLVADLFSLGMMNSALSYFGGMPLIHFQAPPGDRWELSVKRWIDIVISALLLIFLSPLLLFIALLVLTSSPGPILFRQTRVGLNGRLFTMLKFRSMYADAEARLEQLKAHNEMSGPVFKMRDDPRVTAVGKFLRRFSLDELPQLWNVLIGDMSLVGPRPPVPGEVNLYDRKDRRRLSMRPGITCTWQVSGRNEIADFESWVQLDLEYIDNWSLKRDLLLLWKTIPAVLLGHGAR
ncbi:MAG: sugar transferase [Bdellovibrionota bacterium]|nr:MAG: sugar transferase [Bdellovibrionota bacterium]